MASFPDDTGRKWKPKSSLIKATQENIVLCHIEILRAPDWTGRARVEKRLCNSLNLTRITLWKNEQHSPNIYVKLVLLNCPLGCEGVWFLVCD